MSSVYPSMRGKFGSTEYFMVTMKANDVANKLVIPNEMPGWGDLDIEERFQREIKYHRVKKQIAPYLAHDPDRFFGALIVAVLNANEMAFEPAVNVLGKGPTLYRTPAKSFGFLTLSGGEMLVPLDGQHRLAAIQFALTGRDEKQNPIEGLRPNADLANDDILLILVKHDADKDRKIFNKVNRYAKRTSKAEDLITADDDVIAVISRETVANEIIGSRLVNYKSNTLPDSAYYFTTLSTVYEATKNVLEGTFGRISTQSMPDRATEALYRDRAREYWEELSDGVLVYQTALSNKEEDGDEKRREIRRTLLLGKPVVQLALMCAVVRLKTKEMADGSRLAWNDITHRINKVDWRSENLMWQHFLMNGSRVVSGRQAVNFASRFIAYYLGEPLEDSDLSDLNYAYLSHFPADDRPNKMLPKRLFE